MQNSLLWSNKEQVLYKKQPDTSHSSNGTSNWFHFDPWTLTWIASPHPTDTLEIVSAQDALKHLKGKLRSLPVGVIGPQDATAKELSFAESLGTSLAKLGLQLLCGGKSGVMQAVAKGYNEAGKLAIGILPDEDWRLANDFIGIPIATGIGRARNAIIAQACPVLVAIGGGFGTLSEMAYGKQFEHLVLALGETPYVPGVIHCDDIDEVCQLIAEYWLR